MSIKNVLFTQDYQQIVVPVDGNNVRWDGNGYAPECWANPDTTGGDVLTIEYQDPDTLEWVMWAPGKATIFSDGFLILTPVLAFRFTKLSGTGTKSTAGVRWRPTGMDGVGA